MSSKVTRSNGDFDPRATAVALAYGQGEAAPRVVAKGRGVLAQEIINRARDANVFVHESPELVALLMQVDLDARIPPQLYVAVAELLAWIYRLEAGITAPPPQLPGDIVAASSALEKPLQDQPPHADSSPVSSPSESA
ncbi:MAG: EscU/YscU/HrcU family type III secretion system export apparatus switch protein [Moraxellaceae bacterium]|nr:EscU/YscU/HrcU family type III secretion system export apparatus switch protein [Moraxellaceae bacterium]